EIFRHLLGSRQAIRANLRSLPDRPGRDGFQEPVAMPAAAARPSGKKWVFRPIGVLRQPAKKATASEARPPAAELMAFTASLFIHESPRARSVGRPQCDAFSTSRPHVRHRFIRCTVAPSSESAKAPASPPARAIGTSEKPPGTPPQLAATAAAAFASTPSPDSAAPIAPPMPDKPPAAPPCSTGA